MTTSTAAAADLVRIDLDDAGVALVRLNRPERMNALDGAMFDAILAAQERLQALPGLRAVVLAGEGRAFCAGIDIGHFERLLREGKVGSGVDLGERSGGTGITLLERTHGIANGPQQVVLGWRALPVPVVAALHGVVFGGGLQIALGADLRIAHPATRLSVLEVAWGLVPDMAGMALMRELLRGDVLRDLVYTGREVRGDEAVALGLATCTADDPLAEARAWAAAVARQSPQAVRAAKRLLNVTLDGAPPADVLMAEAREQHVLLGSDEQIATVRARLKR